MNQVQNLSQYGMWNYTATKHQAAAASADGSWEVRSFTFAADTAGAMGTSTGPPRHYTCSFCRREFRSAQALGGHMNVHRRDRARLCQSPQGPAVEPSPASMVFSSSELVAGAAGGGLFLFYPTLPSQYGPVFARALMDSPSSLLSMSTYQAAVNFPTVTAGSDDSSGSATDTDGGLDKELDLELRLGWP